MHLYMYSYLYMHVTTRAPQVADGLEEPAGDVPIALLPGDPPPVALVLPPEEPKKRDSVTLLTDVEGAVEEGKVTKRDARKARQAKVSSHLFFLYSYFAKVNAHTNLSTYSLY